VPGPSAATVRARWETWNVAGVTRDESSRLFTYSDHHKRLVFRIFLVIAITAVIDLCCSFAIYYLERHGPQTEIKSWGQALFFTTVQLLTVSSQLKNPVTPGGRALDVFLELWAVLVVAGSAGAIAAFYQDVKSSS
jgi:hypothetical protein